MAAPRCSVCFHVQKSEIDAALMEGRKIVSTAQEFGVSKSALARHRTGCLATKLAAAAKVVAPTSTTRAEVQRAKAIASGQVAPVPDDILSLTGLLGRLARSLERLEAAADTSLADNTPTALAAVSGQLHRGIETVAKMQGLYVAAAEPRAPAFNILFNLDSAGGLPAPPMPAIPQPVGSTLDTIVQDVQKQEAGDDPVDSVQPRIPALPAPRFRFSVVG